MRLKRQRIYVDKYLEKWFRQDPKVGLDMEDCPDCEPITSFMPPDEARAWEALVKSIEDEEWLT